MGFSFALVIYSSISEAGIAMLSGNRQCHISLASGSMQIINHFVLGFLLNML